MFCGKCGTKLDNNAKFCGKCGTKVNSQSNVNATSLDSFIGNIVQKTNEQSTDEDIFSQIEEENLDKNTKKNNTASKKTKAQNKVKQKAKPKPKVKKAKKTKKVKKSSSKKEHKKINIKLIITIIVLFFLIVLGASLFVFFKFGDDIFANNYVKSAVAKTFKQMDKSSEKLNQIPNLILRSNSENKLNEREIYLEVKDAKGGLINEDILGSLEGLSLKTNEKYNSEKNLFNAKLTFSNNKKEEIYGEIFSSPEVATISMPELYSDTLGITMAETEEGIANVQYQTKMSEMVELLSEYELIYSEFSNSLKGKSKVLAENIFTNCEFKMESKNKETGERIYNTTLDNILALETLKAYLEEIKADEYIKKPMSYIVYLIESKQLSYSETAFTSKVDSFISSIDNAITSERVEDIEFKILINDDKIIKNISFNTIIDGIGVEVSLNVDDSDSLIDYKVGVKLINVDDYLAFDIESLTEETADEKVNKKNILTFSTSYNDKIELSFNKEYDIKNYNYISNVDFIVDSSIEKLSAGYDLDGKYQVEKDLARLNIDSFKIDADFGLYKFYFDFEGYIQQKNSDVIEDLDLENVIFIDNMSDTELEKIKTEIYKNGYEFLDLFGSGEW